MKSANLLIVVGISMNRHISEKSQLFYLVLIKKVMKLTAVVTKGYHCYQLHTEFYPISILQG
jgi:hypothetical protein